MSGWYIRKSLADYREWVAIRHPGWVIDLPTPDGIWIASKGETLVSAPSSYDLDNAIEALENHAS